MNEVFEKQADGRLVAGPALTPERAARKVGALAAAIVFVASLLSFTAGHFLFQPSLHDLLVDRLEAGCVVDYRAVTTNDLGAAKLDSDAKEAVDTLKAGGAERVESSTGTTTDAMRGLDPTGTHYGVVSWEMC